MDAPQTCQHCGRPLGPRSVQGLCAECFLKVGLGSGTAVDAPGTATAKVRTPRFKPPAPESLARLFPNLQILELIGHGGMGAVYKTVQSNLDRLVALKILPPEVGADPAFAERFTREARTLARLTHPNIIAVHDVGQAGEYYFFLMEYVDGLNLRQLLAAHQLSAREALTIVPQICEALQYAHDRGIVHRDIKPENILVDKSGRVKIADFGLAKLLGRETQDQRITDSQSVMGTPHYMAPEQIEQPREVDHRADIFSLGVVFYEMLTGELPLGRFAPPSQKVQVDVRLDEVVLKALEKQPERRYQQANQVKTEVETISTHRAPATNPPEASAKGMLLRTYLGWAISAIVLVVLTIMLIQNQAKKSAAAMVPTTLENANDAARLEDALPVVVRTVPAAGSIDVDPALTEIQVTFSKPMMDGSWSWSTYGEEYYPQTTGEPRYLADARTCVLPVTLEPGHTYALWLNSAKFTHFQDTAQRPAVPYLLVFRTKP